MKRSLFPCLLLYVIDTVQCTHMHYALVFENLLVIHTYLLYPLARSCPLLVTRMEQSGPQQTEIGVAAATGNLTFCGVA